MKIPALCCIWKERKGGNALFNNLKKEESVLFNDTLNTFSYGYMASDIW